MSMLAQLVQRERASRQASLEGNPSDGDVLLFVGEPSEVQAFLASGKKGRRGTVAIELIDAPVWPPDPQPPPAHGLVPITHIPGGKGGQA